MDNAPWNTLRHPERLASAWLGNAQQERPVVEEGNKDLDRILMALVGRTTGGISPVALWMAYLDWITHVQLSPSKQHELLIDGWHKMLRWQAYAHDAMLHADAGACGGTNACVTPLPQDKRFADPAWQKWPFNLMSQGFLMSQQWWHRATTGIAGVSKHHEEVATFAARQLLDMFSPSNFISTNPVVIHEALRSRGQNFLHGAANAASDWLHALSGQAHGHAFKVGETLAVTPGKVIYRNRLMELIQYTPATPNVHTTPVLIVPAWIMKYYILDLSPHNSLTRYLVEQGHTVFMISWKNPDAGDRNLSMDDYRMLGIMEAIETICRSTDAPALNAVGYCLGGTLLSIAAATMARDGDRRLASMSLFASQVDFKEPGELSLFIDESQVALLDALMWEQGYLDSSQMAGAFQLLRSNDLIWSRRLNHYLLGLPEKVTDLMAWNMDTTRMPYRMHSQYLHDLFLHNDLAEGRYCVNGQPVALSDIRVPVFSVGTITDHVAPWRSTYKIHLLTDTAVTYCLTSGGHNAGVISPPGHPNRQFQIARRLPADPYVSPEDWLRAAPSQEGSWWPAWESWLASQSTDRQTPPAMPPALCDAPGTYVFQR
jgi:polyhydroxyalkanoate synthase